MTHYSQAYFFGYAFNNDETAGKFADNRTRPEKQLQCWPVQQKVTSVATQELPLPSSSLSSACGITV